MSELKRPIHIDEFRLAIRDLSDKELANIKKSINNSVQKLNTSNELMQQSISELKEKLQISLLKDEFQESSTIQDLQNDISLYNDSINENKIVLDNQLQRLDVLGSELGNRGLSESAVDDDVKDEKLEIKLNSVLSQDNDDIKDGIYL